MLENYDFDLILSREDFRRNKEQKCITKKKKYRLKRWVKNLSLLVLGALIGIAIYQLCFIKTIHATPAGNYTCKGEIVKICTGNKNVANYLGV